MVDIPEEIKSKLDIIPVQWIDKVIEIALTRIPQQLNTKQKQKLEHSSKKIIATDKPIAH